MKLNPIPLIKKGWSWFGPGGNWKVVILGLMALSVLLYIVSLRLNLAAERQGRADDRASVATERADALQTASTARSGANESRSTARTKITAEQSANRTKLDEALKANEAWANQPIPPAVLDSLQ